MGGKVTQDVSASRKSPGRPARHASQAALPRVSPLLPRVRDPLAAAFEPQVEQLGVSLVRNGDALRGVASNELVDAEVSVRLVGGCFAITSHRIRVKRDVRFYEQGFRGLCMSSLAADCVPLCPVVQPDRLKERGNVVTFGMEGEQTCCWLRAGTEQDATSVMMLPEWISRLGERERLEARKIMGEAGSAFEGDGTPRLDRAIQAAARAGGTGGTGEAVVRSVRRALALALAWHEARDRAEQAAGTHAQARLVREAKRLVENNLSDELTLDELAHDLLTSRSRLCAAFQQETGMGVGAFVRHARIRRARELLGIGSLSIAEIAREVGYPRASSFSVAFKREMGMGPSAWREGTL